MEVCSGFLAINQVDNLRGDFDLPALVLSLHISLCQLRQLKVILQVMKYHRRCYCNICNLLFWLEFCELRAKLGI